jgi:beta-lactamase regulating signal transducer with metallopeptidase domain
MIAGLLDHLWQSTLFAAGIAVMALLFRRNGAAVRFWLWFAASVKFLLPFALPAMAGEYLSRLLPASHWPQSLLAIQPAAEKFSAPAQMLAARHGESFNLAPLLLGIWLAGFGVILGVRLLRWSRLRAVMQAAQDLPPPAPAPVAIKASSSLLEPGLVGILRPVVLLPTGLMARLSNAERDSILAHEFSHLERGDNVTAALHMAVEALFWFYPPVWLIGARLIAERERACDERVLARGHDPEVYAGGILKVCKFCIQSPLACASGASGADLKRRVRQIMTEPAAIALSPAKRGLLAGAAAMVLVVPVIAGFADTPLVVSVKRDMIAVKARAEQAVTAVAQTIGVAPAERVAVRRLPRLKVQLAAELPALEPVQSELSPAAVAPAAVAPEPVATAALAPAPVVAPTPPPAKQAVLALNPTGEGDPDGITCRVPQELPGSRLAGPQVCKPNRTWAELRANHQEISPDGRMIVYLDDFQHQKAMAPNCRTYFKGGNVNILAGPSTTFCF